MVVLKPDWNPVKTFNKLQGSRAAMTHFASKQEASQYLKLSGTTLKRYRLQGLLIEGIHWIRLNSRCIRYNLDLIQDWLHNRHDPIAHQRAIEIYQANLLSNQRKSRKRTTESSIRDSRIKTDLTGFPC
jgi:hypothetical protein